MEKPQTIEALVHELFHLEPAEERQEIIAMLRRQWIKSVERLKTYPAATLEGLGIPLDAVQVLKYKGYLADSPVKEVTLLVPSHEDPTILKEKRIINANSEKIVSLMGKVSLTPCSPEASLESMREEFKIINFPFELENGKTYFVNFLHDFNIDDRIKALENYRTNASKFLEDSAAEFAVTLLKEKGYTNPRRYCGLRNGGNFQIDAAAVADEACILVECKTNIDKRALDQLERTYDLLRSSQAADFADFRNRPVFRAVAGSIAGNKNSQMLVCKELIKRKIGVLLASGSSLTIGDGCIGRESFIPSLHSLVPGLYRQFGRYGHVLLSGRR